MGPKGVSVDQNGHVIVVDNKACTVFIFQLTGKLITKFGSRGNGDKQFAGAVMVRYISNCRSCPLPLHSLKALWPSADIEITAYHFWHPQSYSTIHSVENVLIKKTINNNISFWTNCWGYAKKWRGANNNEQEARWILFTVTFSRASVDHFRLLTDIWSCYGF